MSTVDLSGNAVADGPSLATGTIHLIVSNCSLLTDVYVSCRTESEPANYGQYSAKIAYLHVSTAEFNALHDYFEDMQSHPVTLTYEKDTAPVTKNVESFTYSFTTIEFQVGTKSSLKGVQRAAAGEGDNAL